MSIPKIDEETRDYFASVLPDDPRITQRPMFGNLAAFVNGNMFTGVFGTQVFVRLPEAERRELLDIAGASVFAPMEGRAMAEYVMLPHQWREEPGRAREWLERSFTWAAALPPKVPKKRK